MCDRTEWLPPSYWTKDEDKPVKSKGEDVRATKTHAVGLTVLVEAEDAGMAVRQVTGALNGIQIDRISATVHYVEQEERW